MIFKHGRIKVKRFYCFLFFAALFVSCFCLFSCRHSGSVSGLPEEEIPSGPGDGGGSGSKGDGGTEAGDGGTEEGDVPGYEDELPPPPENPEMFYIVFDPNGGSGERIYEKRGKNTNYFSAYTSFFRTGYAFLGWTKKRNSAEILFRDGSVIPVTENLVFYAVWVPEEEAYTVSFDLQGGLNNGMPEKLSCLPGQSVLLPPLSNTYKEGFVRLGYSRDGTADSGILEEETEYFPSSDTRIFVVWGDGCYPQYAGTEKWVQGVSVLENDWKIYQSEYGNKVAFWNSDAGWYDVYQGDKFLCWAAVSTNMLLWWYDLNKEVFEGKDVTYRSSTVNKATFNSVITEALENRKIISIDITSYGAHVITIWGASYGNDGFIQGLYLADPAVSNEIYGVDAGGLQYSEVIYQDGKPFVYYNGGNNSAPVVTLYTFSSCQDIWSLY